MSFYLNPPLKPDDGEWPEHWPEWVKDAVNEIDAIEQRFPSTLLDGTPKWVDKMSLRIIQCMHPTTDMHPNVSGPAFLGSMLGHLMWLKESDDGFSALMKRLDEASEKFDKDRRKALSRVEYEKLITKLENSAAIQEMERMAWSFYRLVLRKTKVMNGCLEDARKQELSEQADFFEAYAQALKKPPLDETGALIKEKSTGISQIYLIMVLNWKFVSKLKSAAKCHIWLCSIFGENVIRNEARIQTMSQTFGIKYDRRKRHQRKKKRKYKR